MRLLSRWVLRGILHALILPAGLWGVARAECGGTIILPAQSLNNSLLAINQQTDCTVYFTPDEVKDIQAPALPAAVNVEKGLKQLLAGTKLKLEKLPGGRSYVVTLDEKTSEVKQSQAGPPTVSAPEPELPKKTTITGEVTVARARPAATVVSSHDVDANFPTTSNYSYQEISDSGAASAGEFARANFPGDTSFEADSQLPNGLGNTTAVSLRGFNSKETMILINGRPQASYAVGSIYRQPDLNAIPAETIKSIEVLTAPAAFVYGPGANGGAVNIKLRDDYSPLEAAFSYRNMFGSNAPVASVSIRSGTALENLRTKIGFTASAAKDAGLTVGQQKNGAGLEGNPQSWTNPPAGSTSNFYSVTGEPLVTTSGLVADSSSGSVPIGYAGPNIDGGQALVDAAGSYNLLPANTAQSGVQARGNLQSLINESHVSSFRFSSDTAIIPDQLNGYFEATHAKNSASFAFNSLTSFYVPAGVPGNPFRQDLKVTTPGFGADQLINTTVDANRELLGFAFALPRSCWATAEYSRSSVNYSSVGAAQVDMDAATAAIASGELDIFRDTSVYGVSFEPYLLRRPTVQDARTIVNGLAVRTTEPCQLWGERSIKVSAALDHHVEHIDPYRSFLYATGAEIREDIPSRSQTADGVYVGATIPISLGGKSVDAARQLEWQIAGRWDSRKVRAAAPYFQVNNEQVGGPSQDVRTFQSANFLSAWRVKVLPAVELRGSVYTATVPPDVNELVPDPLLVSSLSFLTDPLRGGEPLETVAYISGGNSALEPEKATGVSAGFQFSPEWEPKLSFSFDWLYIRKRDKILPLSVDQQSLDMVLTLAPSRVIRSPAAQGDLYSDGSISYLDLTRLNVGRQEVETYDFALDFRSSLARFGTLLLRANATYLKRNQIQLGSQAPGITLADVGSVLIGNEGLGSLKWRGNVQLQWSLRDIAVRWSTRYLSSYCASEDCSDDILRTPKQIYNDVLLSIRDSGDTPVSSGVGLQVGVRNVFRRQAPWDNGTQSFSPVADPRGRTYFVSLRYSL